MTQGVAVVVDLEEVQVVATEMTIAEYLQLVLDMGPEVVLQSRYLEDKEPHEKDSSKAHQHQ